MLIEMVLESGLVLTSSQQQQLQNALSRLQKVPNGTRVRVDGTQPSGGRQLELNMDKMSRYNPMSPHSRSSDNNKKRPIAAGWYCTEDGKTTSVAHWLDEEDFRSNGGVMNHETIESISKRRKPFTVDYTGFGWLLIEKGVFESLEYPWFAPKMQVFESGEVQDMCGEDVSFCLDAKEEGFEIWCDPRVRVGHEKTRII